MSMIIHSFFGGQLDKYCRQSSHLQRKIFDKTRKAQLFWSVNYASDQTFSMRTSWCGNFCAIRCRRIFENVCADACVNHFWCRRAPHICTSILQILQFELNISFFVFFFEKCAGAGVGAKTDVWVHEPHTTKMCAMCVWVQPKI